MTMMDAVTFSGSRVLCRNEWLTTTLCESDCRWKSVAVPFTELASI